MIRLRLALPVLAAAASLLVNAGPVAASSGHTVSQTNNYHGSWTESGDVNPCTGDPMDVTFDGNMVEHVTYFPDSDEVWATFTETGSISAMDNGVTYGGHATAWGNFNLNKQNANSAFTLEIRAYGSDGSEIIAHETTVTTLNANGVVTVNFDKLNLTCG